MYYCYTYTHALYTLHSLLAALHSPLSTLHSPLTVSAVAPHLIIITQAENLPSSPVVVSSGPFPFLLASRLPSSPSFLFLFLSVDVLCRLPKNMNKHTSSTQRKKERKNDITLKAINIIINN